MSYSSQILKDNFEKSKRINQNLLVGQEAKIKSSINNIEKCKDNINGHWKEIKKRYEAKRQSIKKLREIMENRENHENSLICNKLKENKKEEYENEINNFNDIIKQSKPFILSTKKLINRERESIKHHKKVLDDEYGISERITDEAIELGRKEIIGECINYLKDNKMNEYGINELQNLINSIHTNQ